MLIAAAQCAPVYLNPEATTEKAIGYIKEAAAQGVKVIAFGETFLSGYPFWLSITGGAQFENELQKQMYARYLEAAICADHTCLKSLSKAAKEHQIYVLMGFMERPIGVASGSVFCSLAAIHPEHGIERVHRKLVPTYEERLVWAAGDGFGLGVSQWQDTNITALNCWENWMPLARHACYGQGSQLHIASWPGSTRLTKDITRFVAKEGRVFVLSASSTLDYNDIPKDLPIFSALAADESYCNGGSAIAGPDGEWVVPPCETRETLVVGDINLELIAAERQNFDPTGHYFRSDVFQIRMRKERGQALSIDE